jgi:hypothetical protein
MTEEPPVPKFRRFERVLVTGEPRHYPELRGRFGTILWRDPDWIRKPPPWASGWLYLVFFTPANVYRTLFESELQSEGTFDPEVAHLGIRSEFSSDIILEEDMTWIEGIYRLPGHFWEVMVFGKKDVTELRFQMGKTCSGTPGIWFDVPNHTRLDREYVRKALEAAFGHTDWAEVSGPDSMVLR